MSGTMKDYLSAATADYNYTFSIRPQKVLVEIGDKSQVVHESDGNNHEVIDLGDNTPTLMAQLEWQRLTAANAATIFDLWMDTSKADGRARSFYWLHPTDGNTYVVKFATNIQKAIQKANIHGIAQITFRVLAYKTT